jgi:hypothetical protein
MKTIVTHIGPDLDAITSVWLVKMFFPGWEEAAVAFVPAGKTLGGLPPDDDPEVIHVDTGFGKFDHHQTDEDTCAALRVYEAVKAEHGKIPALERLLAVVNDTDHFREAFFPNPTSDYWDVSLPSLIDGWRLIYADNPMKTVGIVMDALDAAYKTFQNKMWAEMEIAEKAVRYQTKWGEAIAVETLNDEVVHLGQKMGFPIVIRRDPKKGYLRIKAVPKPDIDLTPLYEALKTADPEATWFLHASRHMILNGSAKNPDMKPTSLPLVRIIEIVTKTFA